MSDWSVVPDAPSSDWSVVPDAKSVEPKKSFLERAGESASALGKGVGALGSTVWSPLDTIRDPIKRRQLARGFSDATTFGIAEKRGEQVEKQASDAVTSQLAQYRAAIAGLKDPEQRARMEQMIANYEQETADSIGETGGWAGTRAADQEAAPEYRTGGQIAGAFTPGGATSTAGKLGVMAARKALPIATTSRLGGSAMGLARGLFGYEATAPLTAAVQATTERLPDEGFGPLKPGTSPLDAAKDAATDPLGLIMSGGGGSLGGLAKGQANKYRDPKTIEGRTVAAVEAGGGQIKPLGSPVRPVAQGAFTELEGMDLPEGRQGMNQLAGQSRDVIKGHNRQVLKEARKKYGDDVDQVLAENAEKSHLAQKAHATLDTLEQENVASTGKVIDKATAKRLAHVRALLTTETDAASGQPISVPAVRVEDMIKVKKFVANSAEWGKPASVKNRPYRMLSEALNEDAASVDPRIAKINAEYAQTMGKLEEANDILFGTRSKNAPKSAAADKRADQKLGRIGDDTQAGTTDRLDQLGKLDPAYAEQLRLLEAKKAMERLRYGEPEVSTSIEKGMGRAVQREVPGAIGAAAGGIPGWIAGKVAGSALANPVALRLRLGLPAAEAGGRFFTGNSGTLMDRLMSLQRQREEDQKRQAQTLTQ